MQTAQNVHYVNGKKLEGKPFLKWAGGKTQLLKELIKHIPNNSNKYIEPFIGSGALYFYVNPKEGIISDLNKELINTYKMVKNDVSALIDELKTYKNNKTFFYKIRADDPNNMNDIQRAARTIYLNKTCFNGLYRVNKKGEFNVPFGKMKNPKISNENNLNEASLILNNTKILHRNYKSVLKNYASPNDFIYLDPPYHPVGGHSDFKRYTKEFFYEKDHVELKSEFDKLIEMGCHVVLTNSNTNFINDLFEGYKKYVVKTKRYISCNPKTRSGEDLIIVGNI